MADTFKTPRDKVADAIEALRAVTVAAGSREARRAQYALDNLGSAFSMLEAASENPAWPS